MPIYSVTRWDADLCGNREYTSLNIFVQADSPDDVLELFTRSLVFSGYMVAEIHVISLKEASQLALHDRKTIEHKKPPLKSESWLDDDDDRPF